MRVSTVVSQDTAGMEQVTISRRTIAEIEQAPNIADLLAEYGRECSISGMPAHCAQWAMYRQMESSGVLRVIAAHAGSTLIGAAFVIINVVPHYGVMTAITESIFVASDYRRGTTGLKLLTAVEELAIESGAAGVFVSAPYGSRLADLLYAIGMRETNRVFFRSLS